MKELIQIEAIVKTTARGYTGYTEFKTYDEAWDFHNKFMEHDNVESTLIVTRVVLNENSYDDFDD